MSEPIHILALSGSLRRDSLNTAVLREFVRLAPEGVSIELVDYRNVPLYDADLGEVPVVEQLKAQVRDAGAVLISTPEYNYSLPGTLKNLLDWLSRPAYRSVLAHKPAGVVSVSPGPIGGARAQAHLKTVLGGTLTPVFPHPDVAIGMGAQRIQNGLIVQEDTRALLRKYLEGFADWARALQIPVRS